MLYFLDGASNELGHDIYSLSGERRAAALLKGLDAFSRYHWYLSTLTTESVYRYDSITPLSLLQIIYIETNEELRLERSARPRLRLEQKDTEKRSEVLSALKRSLMLYSIIMDRKKAWKIHCGLYCKEENDI
jgi:hypothetical protein